ncbi:MAG: hypothetical protein WEB30_17625 [Cyclobacteriaceae bacterium]
MKKLMLYIFLLTGATASAQTAKEIIKKVEDKMRGNSNRSTMKMTIVRPE